jgi:phage gp36-like protein
MTMQPLCKQLDLGTLANMLGTVDADGASPAIDYLLDTLAGQSRNDVLADVLLLYSRDGLLKKCPNANHYDGTPSMAQDGTPVMVCQTCGYTFTMDSWFTRSLIRVDFPQPTLCRWLEAVGEHHRATEVARRDLRRDLRNGRSNGTWFVCVDGQSQAWKYYFSEHEGKLGLKRDVLELFPDVERKVEHRGKSLSRRELTEPVYREGYGQTPVDHRWLGAYLELDGKRLELRRDRTADIRQDADSKEYVVVEMLRPVDFLPHHDNDSLQTVSGRNRYCTVQDVWVALGSVESAPPIERAIQYASDVIDEYCEDRYSADQLRGNATVGRWATVIAAYSFSRRILGPMRFSHLEREYVETMHLLHAVRAGRYRIPGLRGNAQLVDTEFSLAWRDMNEQIMANMGVPRQFIDGPTEMYFAGTPLGRTDLPPTIEPRE